MRRGIIFREVCHGIRVYRRKHRIKTTRKKDEEIAEMFLTNWRKEYISKGDEFLDVWLNEKREKMFK